MSRYPQAPEKIHSRREWEGWDQRRRGQGEARAGADPYSPHSDQRPSPFRPQSRNSPRQRCQHLSHPLSLAPSRMPTYDSLVPRTRSRQPAKAHDPKLPVLLPGSCRRRRRHVFPGRQPEPEMPWGSRRRKTEAGVQLAPFLGNLRLPVFSGAGWPSDGLEVP